MLPKRNEYIVSVYIAHCRLLFSPGAACFSDSGVAAGTPLSTKLLHSFLETHQLYSAV